MKSFDVNFSRKQYDDFIIGADVGGTNTNIGLFGMKKGRISLLFSLHYYSRKLKKLDDAICHFMDFVKINFDVKISRGTLAVAGAVNEKKDRARITNTNWNVDAKSISKSSGIKIMLINDFEAIGFGINSLGENDFRPIKGGEKVDGAPIAVIGAGTGLGRSTLIYDQKTGYYQPIPSEGGHTDLAAQNKEELELLLFIKKQWKIRQNVPFEMVLSGKGISTIYRFYLENKKSGVSQEISRSHYNPSLISKYRKEDSTCKKTFEIFAKFYARFAKDCALDCLSYGGIYIAGGIAPKNPEIFNDGFVKEFENNWRHPEVLRRIPIYLITNHDMGLLGAGFAAHITGSLKLDKC